jgi:Ca2+-binding RTX toxin-like protein
MAQTTASKTRGRARSTTLTLALAAVALLVSSTGALAEIKVGTDLDDTVVGTNAGDRLTGKGGSDTLKGLAGNDTYHFANFFGEDSLEERAAYKAGTKKLPGGTDTLSFARFTSDPLWIGLVPAWAAQGYNGVNAGPDDGVELGTSPVENVVGGRSDDTIHGGAGKNTYSGGLGGDDKLYDWGGWKDDGTFAAQAVSDDVYKGFASATGHDEVYDYAGAADRLDLRPLESSDVYIDAFDHDGAAANGHESLKIVVDDATSVSVVGYFAPAVEDDAGNGRIEQIVFSDETFTRAAEIRSLVRASSDEEGVVAASRELLETPIPRPLPAEAR